MKTLLLVLLLISVAIPASAETLYQAEVQVNEWHNDTNVNTGSWVPHDLILFTNNSNKVDFADFTIKFIRGITEETGYFTITGDGIENSGVQLTEGADAKLIRDIVVENGNHTKKLKVQLFDIRSIYNSTEDGTATVNTSSSENPVYAYVYYDRELPMAKGKVNNFDGEDYTKQTGWTTEGGVSEVNVYFRRKDTAIPMSITVKAQSTEPKVTWSDRTAKYTIDSNGNYEFTIKYEIKNIWGWKEEFTEVYTLVTTGMSSSNSGTKAIVAEAPYETIVGDEFVLTMSTVGKFEAQTGVDIVDAGNRKYAFTFDKPGLYEMNFKGDDGGSAIVKFSVKSKPTTTDTTTTNTANQQQNNDGEGGSLMWYLILVVAIVGLGYLLFSRKKKSNSYQLHPKAQ